MIFTLFNTTIKKPSLLLWLCLIFATQAYGQTKSPIQFTHLTTANGLSQSTVNCILKDHYGFMWFGTQDGLNKYDGYTFKVYRHNPKDPNSIPYNYIRCLLEDSSGNLWVGTLGGGLALYNRSQDSFTVIGSSGIVNKTLNSKVITSIYEDRQHNLWVGTFSDLNLVNRQTKKVTSFTFAPSQKLSETSNATTITSIYEDQRNNFWIGTTNGLILLNRKTGTFSTFLHNPQVKTSNSSNVVNAITEDSKGLLWIATGDGLNLYNYQAKTFSAYKNDIHNSSSISDNVVITLCNAENGKLWVATEEALDLFDTARGTFTHFQKNARDERSLSYSSASSLLLDDQKILWVGTFSGGVNKYDKNQFKFSLYRNFGTDVSNLNSNIVTSFAETPQGNVWIGTDGGGLYLWRPSANEFTPHNTKTKGNYFPSLSVLCLKLSHDKNFLWIGTYDKGLARLNLRTKAITYYEAGEGDDKLSKNSVYALLEDSNGNIWIGTNGGGVNVLNTSTGKIKRFNNKSGNSRASSDYIRALFEDTTGDIWVGTFDSGIKIYNPVSQKFTSYTKANSNLGSDVIYSIYRDSKANIWVGTMGGGLNLFDQYKKKFTSFTESQGLTNNIVNSIIEDRYGSLWISTDNGISCFDPQNKSFKNFNHLSGLQSDEFNIGAGYRTITGEILFGGLDGFNIFDPGDINDNLHIPPVVITDFQLFNKSEPVPTGQQPLYLNINTTRQITLSHNQSVFTIEFAALGYTIPEKNRYAYMLEGFDKKWNYVGIERKATYTNLDPGKYTFRVIASNNDGLWNKKSTSLQIIIKPPFWKTGLAYIFYAAIICCILYLIYKEIRSREKLKNEVIYQKLITDKTQELNQLKVNFFTNISHELRTPLSLIIDPLRKIIDEEITVAQAKRYSSLVFNNACRLMNLVNQLLDFRKLETGNWELEAEKVELVAIIRNVFEAFAIRAKERNISYFLDLKVKHLEAWIDTDKLEKILYNLISNAFKYTPNQGKISILVKELQSQVDKKLIEIHVRDSGVGIPEALKTKIFDPFYQVKGSLRFEQESSGVGLALTRELVLLHKGEIFVSANEGEGTDFVVRIPIGEKHFSQNEVVAAGTVDGLQDEVINMAPALPERNIARDELQQDLPIILIVEDNRDLSDYIAEELRSNYHVEQAWDGIEGFQKATDIIPDLIISDIMMPGSDGIDLCNKLKADEKTSHIPIILLTAKQTNESKIEGYAAGADDYIAKPFNSALLAVRIKNILQSRKKLRELFSTHSDNPINESAISQIDKEFLRKAVKIIEENLANLAFDIDKLAETLKMSRRQLYRKLKALTNQTAHDFMMNVRLEHAAALLLAGNYNISEIAYQVGFSEPANFSRSFTKKFGRSPKKYLSEQ